MNEVAGKVATTAAIGNTYIVSGTITVDGEQHSVSAEIGVEPAENLIVNGDFEAGNAGEWIVSNEGILFIASAGENPRNGSKGCATFNTYNVADLTADANGCYAAAISQTIKNLPAGVYEARTYFEGLDGAGKNTGEFLNISAEYGNTTQISNNVTLYGWMTWQTAVVSNIVITEEMVEAGTNSVTLSVNVSLLASTWGSIDDFYLYKTGDAPVEDDDNDGNATDENANQGTISGGAGSSDGTSHSENKIVEQIKNTESGKTLHLTVGKDGMTTVVTEEILKSAKDGKVDLVIDMGDYTWTIKADSIKSTKNVDLKVILDTKEIPENKIKEFGKNISYRQLSLAYDGEFDFTATLTVNVGSEHKGKYGNLYYYNDKKELEFIDSAVIGANGNVSLEFTHASDYVIVIGENMESTGANTGDQTPILPFVFLMLAGCAIVAGVIVKRKCAK